jgi:hypothetical protein
MMADEMMTDDDDIRIAYLKMQAATLDYLDTLGEVDDDAYIPGCGEFDTRDARGERRLPARNEAGEPRWM